MSDEAKEIARLRLGDLTPHLKIAAEMAKLQNPGGKVGLAVISTNEDGTGRVTATFECEQFFDDLELILDIKPEDMEDDEQLAQENEPV